MDQDTQQSDPPSQGLPSGFQGVMPIGEHLEDLRRRLILAVLGLLPIAIGALIIGDWLLEVLIRPVQHALTKAGLDPTLQATSPLETFYAYIRIAIIATVLVGSPWLLYQAWKFVAPGLYAAEKRFVYVLLPLSISLTATGVTFLYAAILPVVLAFFITFGAGLGDRPVITGPLPQGATLTSILVLDHDPIDPPVGAEWINTKLNQRRVCIRYEQEGPVILGSGLTKPAGVAQQYKISEYVKLFMNLAIAFAVGFQTPVVVLLLGWAGIIDRATLGAYRKHIMMGCAVAAAILTPADPFSMILLAIPLYLLFEFGSILILLMPADRVARGFRSPKVETDERAQPRTTTSEDPIDQSDDDADNDVNDGDVDGDVDGDDDDDASDTPQGFPPRDWRP